MAEVNFNPIAMAGRSIARAFTMAIINPKAYTVAAEALIDIGKVVALKAAAYMVEELQNIVDLHNQSTALVKELREQAFQLGEILIARKVAVNVSKYYTFRINPSNLDKSFDKIRDNKLTGGGYRQDTHGMNLIRYTYQGTTGNMAPPLSLIRMPQFTAAWHYLALFEEFFTKQNEDLIFVLDDEAIVGRFDNFSYGLNANNPWEIKYKFQISCYPDTKFGLMDGYVAKAFQAVQPVKLKVPKIKLPGFSGGASKIDVFENTLGVI